MTQDTERQQYNLGKKLRENLSKNKKKWVKLRCYHNMIQPDKNGYLLATNNDLIIVNLLLFNNQCD